MPKHEGEGLLHTLVNAFQDTNLGISRYRSFPFVQDETAQSHLFRIMDFWNIEMRDDTSTNAISKEVILTLFQCAAKLYEDEIYAKVAVDLIESPHTRAILSLGIQDVLCRVDNQHDVEGVRSYKSGEKNNVNQTRRADLAIIFEHISSLCHSHGAALQYAFGIPKIEERFMFHNFVTLSKAFNRYEKSWLVTLLPNVFKWEGQGSGDSAKADGLLAPNFGVTKELKQDASSNVSKVMPSPSPVTTPNIIGGVNMSYEKPVSLESVESLHCSLPWATGEPSPLVTDGRAPLSLGQASTLNENEVRGVCWESETGSSDSDFESFTITNKVLQLRKWIDLLPKRAIKYPRSTSARTVTSPLHEPIEFQDEIMSQNEEKRPIGINIERKDASNHHNEWKDSLLLVSSDILDGDWDLLGSGDDSESIFRFSPDTHNDSTNGKLPSTLLEDAANKHRLRISSAKDAQHALSSVSPPCLQLTNKDSQMRSKMLEPDEWMRGHQNKTKLATILEEPHGQKEVEDRHNGPETALKMADTLLLELLHAPHNQEAA